jgi:hypothetical protein
VLGPILGCLLSGTWHSGGSTFWKPIDYFPYSVKTILVVKPFGREFWVETTENEKYRVTYPCSEKQSCWTKSDEIPTDPSDGEYVDYKVGSGRCENNNFVYPLFRTIIMCITSATHAPDATYTVSLALTNNNELWIWDQPYEDPFSVIISIFSVTAIGAVFGLFAGIFFLIFSPSKRKRKP